MQPITRRQFAWNMTQIALGAAALTAGGLSWAQGAPAEGVEYRTLKTPQATQEPGKVQVLEFFRYGCPACNAFEPSISEWKKTLPPQIVFTQIAVAFPEQLLSHARMFYALQSMGKEDALHRKIFAAIHQERKALSTDEQCADFVATNGVDRAAYLQAVASFTVQSRINRAKQLAQAYNPDGVPTLAVQGKYLTSPAMAGGYQESLNIVNFLVRRELAALPASKAPAAAASAASAAKAKRKPKQPEAQTAK